MHLLRRSVVSVMLLALGACGGGDLTLPSEGQPAQIKALSGDDQTGTILEPAQDSLVVRVTDPFGSPGAGVPVTAQVASGQGSLRGTTSRSTDANGQVAFDDLAIVGGPGARTLIFAAPGYAPAVSTPVSLGVGAPATVTIAAGDGQTAT